MAWEQNLHRGGNTRLKAPRRLGVSGQPAGSTIPHYRFYELELGEVIDIIYNDEHPDFPKEDYSYIGAAKVRLVNSNYDTPDKLCPWIKILDSNIKQYPLKGEYVVVAEYLSNQFYTQNLNLLGSANNNSVPFLSVTKTSTEKGKKKDYAQIDVTKTSKPAAEIGDKYKLGEHFKNDDLVRTLQHYEGDVSFSGRFGQSIRFGSNKEATFLNKDVKVEEDSPNIILSVGKMDRDDVQPEPKYKPIDEDINKDGSSLWMVTDQEVTFEPATQDGGQHNKTPGVLSEAGSFKDEHMAQGQNKLDIKVDLGDDGKYMGKQIFVNSDRLVFNAKEASTKHGSGQIICYSKSWQYFNTDNRFMVDSGKGTTLNTLGDTEIISEQQISLQTKAQTVIDSPKIFLGKSATEPVVLGDTILGLLNELIAAINAHIHPTPAGPSGPPVNAGQFSGIDSRWKSFLSPQNKTL